MALMATSRAADKRSDTSGAAVGKVPLHVGVFLPIDTVYGREVLRGIGQYVQEHPHIRCSKFSERLCDNPATLKEKCFDGVIAKVGDLRAETNLIALGVPVVNFSGQYLTRALPTLTSDDGEIGRMAFAHLQERGYRSLAYCGTSGHYASELRRSAFTEAVQRAFPDAEVPTLHVPDGDMDTPFSEAVRQELGDWVEGLPKPVGIFTFTDRLGIEIDDACWRRGLKVPQEVAILGVGNDLTRIDFAHVPLSSIQLPTIENGYLAAQVLDEWIASGSSPDARTEIPPRRLIARKSTDAYAFADERVSAALAYIKQNLANPVRVDEVARATGVSRRTLEQRFHQHLRKSVYTVIQELKFERAFELLGDPYLPVADIAFNLGYADCKTFSRAFRNWFHKSPTEVRKTLIHEKTARIANFYTRLGDD
jgi:LacI family transcriptional regulator